MFFKSKVRKLQDQRCDAIAGILRQQFEHISTLGRMLPDDKKALADERLRSSFTTGYLHSFINLGLDALAIDGVDRAKLVLRILPKILPSLIAHADQERLSNPDDLFEKGVVVAERDFAIWASDHMPTMLTKYIIQGDVVEE